MTKETKELLNKILNWYEKEKKITVLAYPKEAKEICEEIANCEINEIKADTLNTFEYKLKHDDNKLRLILSSANAKIEFVKEYNYFCTDLINKYWNELDKVIDVLVKEIVRIDKEKETKDEQ